MVDASWMVSDAVSVMSRRNLENSPLSIIETTEEGSKPKNQRRIGCGPRLRKTLSARKPSKRSAMSTKKMVNSTM